jgi:pimeloyl-ACP methyl ester carboxylesterase
MAVEQLVLLPGLLCDEAVWVEQRAALASQADSFVADYNGLDSIRGMAEKVLDTAPYPVFSLAGHSMGGRVAMEVVRLAPQRVRRLALLDTGFEPIAVGQAAQVERDKRMKLLAVAQEQGMRAMGKLWAPGMVHPDQIATPLFESILDMIERRTPRQFEAQITALLVRPDATPVLRSLTCPTVFICGRQDLWSPLERHEAMLKIAPAHLGSLHAIEDCGHMSTMERPQAVSNILAQWLAA